MLTQPVEADHQSLQLFVGQADVASDGVDDSDVKLVFVTLGRVLDEYSVAFGSGHLVEDSLYRTDAPDEVSHEVDWPKYLEDVGRVTDGDDLELNGSCC